MLIVYRACSTGSINKERPIEGKYNLVKKCFGSFIEAFKGYKPIILLDKPNEEFRELFKGYEVIESFHPDFTSGNVGTFHKQIDLALEAKEDFFFVEDDYFFLPDSGKKIVEAIKELPFVTPYDHPGYYFEDTHDYKRNIKLIGNQHWQTIISTTLTFGGQYQALKEVHEKMRTYGWADHPMWVDVIKEYALWSPIPTLATHMETPHLAPGIDLKTFA